MHVTCKFGVGGSPRGPPGVRENFCKPSRGGMCHVPCATNRPMTGTIVVPPFWRVEWFHAGPDPTSRSGAIPENAWTHIHPDWLTDWLTRPGQLFFTDPPVEIFVHRTFNANAFERSFTTILDDIMSSLSCSQHNYYHVKICKKKKWRNTQKKLFSSRVTTSLKLIPPKRKLYNFLLSANLLYSFPLKTNHSWNKGGGRLSCLGRFAPL